MKPVDLRSDTVTRPTAAMMSAMANAVVGDDVLGDDPTVIELERLSAETVGMEAALFLCSGTMGNQIALACHTERGDCALFEENAHMLQYEVGGPGIIAQVVCKGVPSHLGVLDPADIKSRIMVGNLHTPATTVLCIENTNNRAGGSVIPVEITNQYADICKSNGMKLHLDGARVFNAAVAQGITPKEVCTGFDSVSFCLSKGLGAPVGSVLCGTSEFINRAKKWRKRLGGGWRQAGYLAACGIYALQNNIDRLAEDHRRARALAEGIQGLKNFKVDLSAQSTNFVMVESTEPAVEICKKLEARGVLALPFGEHRVRCVLHLDIDDAGVEHTIKTFRELS